MDWLARKWDNKCFAQSSKKNGFWIIKLLEYQSNELEIESHESKEFHPWTP